MTSLLLMSLLSFLTPKQASVDLVVTIPNIEEYKGEIVIGIFDKSDSFLEENAQYRELRFPIQSNMSAFVIEDVRLRNCALAIYHDLNSDGECNLNILGIPKEGYGFSNNVRPRFCAPSYEACRVNLQQRTNITVNLIY